MKTIPSLVLILLGLGLDVATAASGEDDRQVAPAIGLTLEVLENATYPSKYADGGEVQLKAGMFFEWTGDGLGRFSLATSIEDMALGDLDGNGVNDAAVILANVMGGGTGIYIELVAVLYDNGIAVPVTSVFLGDRVKVSVSIVDGRIKLDMVVHSDDDGLCCPTLAVSRDYVLKGSALVLVDEPS